MRMPRRLQNRRPARSKQHPTASGSSSPYRSRIVSHPRLSVLSHTVFRRYRIRGIEGG